MLYLPATTSNEHTGHDHSTADLEKVKAGLAKEPRRVFRWGLVNASGTSYWARPLRIPTAVSSHFPSLGGARHAPPILSVVH